MKVDCLECANLKTDISWGPHTEAPSGYCSIKKAYLWKTDRNCTRLKPITSLDWVNDPAISVEAARRHHLKHGDMDGHTCLLARCALHYPQSPSLESTETPKEKENKL